MRALITGIAGFAGSHLAEELLSKGYDIFGTHLPGESLKNLDSCIKSLGLFPLDFNQPENIPEIYSEAKPDYIFHLAAMPSVARSFDKPLETYKANLLGTFQILEAARKLKKLKGLLLISSADIYGVVKPKDMPLDGSELLQPVSPYGISKAAAEMMGYQYFKNYGLPVIRVRAFPHSGPRQARGFVIPDFCSQIAALEKSGNKKSIKIGNLKARRDISDVRDIVRGYRLALEKGKPDVVYHLCNGRAFAVSGILKKLVKMASVEIKVEFDPKLSRPTDIPVIIGDPALAEKKLGYKRIFSIDDTLRDCLDYYRSL